MTEKMGLGLGLMGCRGLLKRRITVMGKSARWWRTRSPTCPLPIHIPFPQLQGLHLPQRYNDKPNFLLDLTSSQEPVELRPELPRRHSRFLHWPRDLPRLQRGRGRQHSQALRNQPDFDACHQSPRILPRKFHQVLHGPVLVQPNSFLGIFNPKPVLLQHRGYGHGFGEVERRELQEENWELDGSAEKEEDLWVGFVATIEVLKQSKTPTFFIFVIFVFS